MAELSPQGNNTEARLLADERFLRRIASFYYQDGHSQEMIASMEYCSRQTVSKALQRAREKGVVRIAIVPDARTGYLRNLARNARIELALEDVILVTGQPPHTHHPNEAHDEVVTEITTAAADYLDQMLTNSDILAVTGGRTFLRNIVRDLKPTKSLPRLRVVATIGFARSQTNLGDANLIAYDLAQAYGAQHQWFPCPALLTDPQQVQQTRQLPLVKDAYQLMTQATIIVTGLWTIHSYANMVQEGLISPTAREAIELHHPVADINHWIFNAAGACINEQLNPPPYYLSGLEVPHLKKRIREGNVKVMLVAGGHPIYVPAIRAVLNAGLANILITDHLTAQMILSPP